MRSFLRRGAPGRKLKKRNNSVRCGVFARLFKSGQARRDAAAYSSLMSIVRDNCDERQIRVDRMVDELRKAQSRRLATPATVKDNDQGVNRSAMPTATRRSSGQVPHLLHTK